MFLFNCVILCILLNDWLSHADITVNDNGYYIGVYDDTYTYSWYSAKLYCERNYDSSLASAHSLNDEIYMADARPNSNIHSWTGLNDIDNESILYDQTLNGGWKWSDGTSYDYAISWAPGEPNDVDGGQDCVRMYGINQMWDDKTCNSGSNQFICNAQTITTTNIPIITYTTTTTIVSIVDNNNSILLPTIQSTNIPNIQIDNNITTTTIIIIILLILVILLIICILIIFFIHKNFIKKNSNENELSINQLHQQIKARKKLEMQKKQIASINNNINITINGNNNNNNNINVDIQAVNVNGRIKRGSTNGTTNEIGETDNNSNEIGEIDGYNSEELYDNNNNTDINNDTTRDKSISNDIEIKYEISVQDGNINTIADYDI